MGLAPTGFIVAVIVLLPRRRGRLLHLGRHGGPQQQPEQETPAGDSRGQDAGLTHGFATISFHLANATVYAPFLSEQRGNARG